MLNIIRKHFDNLTQTLTESDAEFVSETQTFFPSDPIHSSLAWDVVLVVRQKSYDERIMNVKK